MHASSYHTPVLVEEALSFLMQSRRGTYVDGTIGGGGHAEALLQRLEGHGRLVGIDADDDALRFAADRLAPFGDRLILRKGNFREINEIVKDCGVGSVEGVLLDLGVSSHQLNEPAKGFSFLSESALDMRLDQGSTLTAGDVVNEYEEEKLADVIWQYGEERHSRRIARALVYARSKDRIQTGKDLTRVIESVVGGEFLTKTLARVFQAIRIEVNGELESLKQGLRGAIDILKPDGRLVVISYHSLEDRVVKETFKSASATSDATLSKFLPPTTLQPKLRIITKKFVSPGEPEIQSNSRARSAKLRAAQKI